MTNNIKTVINLPLTEYVHADILVIIYLTLKQKELKLINIG